MKIQVKHQLEEDWADGPVEEIPAKLAAIVEKYGLENNIIMGIWDYDGVHPWLYGMREETEKEKKDREVAEARKKKHSERAKKAREGKKLREEQEEKLLYEKLKEKYS